MDTRIITTSRDNTSLRFKEACTSIKGNPRINAKRGSGELLSLLINQLNFIGLCNDYFFPLIVGRRTGCRAPKHLPNFIYIILKLEQCLAYL